ncbi:sodium:proton antiporter, partial [bacterium]|nr:sodium:proton antiporter [bacterium]
MHAPLPRLFIGLALLLILFGTAAAFASEPQHDTHAEEVVHTASSLGQHLPIWSAIPFAGILLSIALFPLFAPVWWHHHYPKVSAFWAVL